MGSSGRKVEKAPQARFTVLGLFEDTLDMERALIALRKAGRSPSDTSVLVRDRNAENGSDAVGAVSRAVSGNTLDAVGGWLVGLAELVMPDHATYLVSGPIGAAVANSPELREEVGRSQRLFRSHEHEPGSGEYDLENTLVYFGFSGEESHYLAHRLGAGDAIIALTTREPESLRATRRLFADCDAVHVGQAQMVEGAFREVQRRLARPAKTAGGEIVVADAVDPFLNLCELDRPPKWAQSKCGTRVVDEKGALVGEIDQILALPVDEPNDERLLQSVRYVIIRFGRVLKLGRRRVAVPKELIDFDKKPPEVHARATAIHRAPAYDPEAPFSRREEEAIFDHFGAQPYWKTGRAAKPSPA